MFHKRNDVIWFGTTLRLIIGTLPAHTVAYEPMRADVDAVSHFQPHVVVAELLIVLAAWLAITDLHGNILPLLMTQIVGQAAYVKDIQYMSIYVLPYQ